MPDGAGSRNGTGFPLARPLTRANGAVRRCRPTPVRGSVRWTAVVVRGPVGRIDLTRWSHWPGAVRRPRWTHAADPADARVCGRLVGHSSLGTLVGRRPPRRRPRRLRGWRLPLRSSAASPRASSGPRPDQMLIGRPGLGTVARRPAVPRDRRRRSAFRSWPRRYSGARTTGAGRQRWRRARRRVRRRTVRSATRRPAHPQPRRRSVRRRDHRRASDARRTCGVMATPGRFATPWTAAGSPLESPLERAARDAERIRHWLAGGGPRLPRQGLSAVVVEHRAHSPGHPRCAALIRRSDPGLARRRCRRSVR